MAIESLLCRTSFSVFWLYKVWSCSSIARSPSQYGFIVLITRPTKQDFWVRKRQSPSPGCLCFFAKSTDSARPWLLSTQALGPFLNAVSAASCFEEWGNIFPWKCLPWTKNRLASTCYKSNASPRLRVPLLWRKLSRCAGCTWYPLSCPMGLGAQGHGNSH